MAEFKAYIRDEEIIYDGTDEKIDLFAQFLEEMEDATDITTCDCKSNDKVREVVSNYFPDYADEIMEMFEDNGGYCDCEVGVSAMTQNSVIKKLGRYLDSMDI